MAGRLVLLVAALSVQWAAAAAETPDQGELNLSLRYRAEFVDDDRFAENGESSTLLLRLHYGSPDLDGWRGVVEFDQVVELGLDEHNSGAGTSSAARNRYPVIADPDGGDVNQAYLQRSLADRGHIRLGRQRILLDNQRFVGGVGWRQNEQTYDAVGLSYQLVSGLNIDYAWVDNVNRIFGNDVPAGDHDSSDHLLQVGWPLAAGQLTGYAFLLDNKDVPALSSDTWGLTWTGKTQFSARPVNYRMQFARQRDAADSPLDYAADYWRMDASIALQEVTLGLGFERLDTDNGVGFATPLATLHAFNGWADQFLNTPSTGLDDLFVSAGGALGSAKWQLLWHNFDPAEGAGSLGSELDASLALPLPGTFSLLLKLARFNGDRSADVTKAWMMLGASF